MKKYGPVFFLFFALAACSASSQQKCLQYIDCNEGAAECRSQAKETCPGGYQQLSDADVGPDFMDFARQHFPGAASGVPHLLVTCD